MNQNAPRQIAMENPRLFEDFRLTASTPSHLHEIGAVGTAYDSVLASDITYVSTPITSGAILYEAMDAAGFTDPADFRKNGNFYEAVIAPNLAAADAVAQAMVTFGGAVIAPAAFEAKALGWTQDEYMGLWLDVIERRATRLAMVDGWEYSNGGAEEYLQALLMQAGRRDRHNMLIVDARGQALGHSSAIILLATAIDNLLCRGHQPVTLARVLHRCILLHGMVADESNYGQLSDHCGRTSFRIGEGYFQGLENNSVSATTQEIKTILSAARAILPEAELHQRSSLELAPGVVRASEKDDLASAPATIIPDNKSSN